MKSKILRVEYNGNVDIVIATALHPKDKHEEELLKRAGFGTREVLVASIMGGDIKAEYDCFAWGMTRDPMRFQAHKTIADLWDTMRSGATIAIEDGFATRIEQVKDEREPELPRDI